MASDDADAEATGLVLVFFLAALAGAVDAAGLARLHDRFVSVMSGNTTSLGVAFISQDWAKAKSLAGLIVLFVAGAAIGAMLATLSGRWRLPVVVAAVAAMLALPVAYQPLAIPAMAVSMGALNAAIQHAGPVMVSVTYVTGSLVRLGQGIGRWLCGQRHGWNWLSQAIPWLGLLLGGVAGAMMRTRLGDHVLWPLPVFAALVAVAALPVFAPQPGSPRWRFRGVLPVGPKPR